MAGNFFQKTLNGEPDTCWCVCVCAGFLCVYTPAIENHQRQLATHTYLGSSLVKTKGENGSLASGTNSVHLRVGLRACCGA